MRLTLRLLPLAIACGLGPLTFDGTPARADEPRDAGAKARGPKLHLSQKAQQAVKDGLRWLASKQQDDGSWHCQVGYKLNRTYRPEKLGSHVGASGLAGMAFLANGHVPGRGAYGQTVNRCVDYLLSQVEESGYITDNGSRMYSHAFAGTFLAEVYGMTRRPEIRNALRRVVKLLVRAQEQNPNGGWRYDPVAKDADLSITVCQLQLLRAASHAGIRVPGKTIQDAQNYVSNCMFQSGHRQVRFFYQSQGGSRTTYALTGAGIVSLYSSGDYSNKQLKPAVDTLFQINENEGETYGSFSYFYGHYYGVQAFYQDGRHWSRFFAPLAKQIVAHQQHDGSWLDRVDPTYATAMATLILSIPNGYLPIFQR
jgi:hypothetical protein